jgi:nanoRNase/pAp phosphatase (c-di-AMP/oligoRNAs hydrolase)
MRNPGADAFQAFLSKHKESRIVVMAHDRADVDSLSSAYSLSRLFPKSVIAAAEEMTEGAKMLAQKLGIATTQLSELDKKDFDGIIAVDTSTYILAPQAKGWKVLCIIDHHRGESRDMKGESEFIDPESPSAAEIIANLLHDEQISKDAAFALSIGIIADGARFKSARMQTFETLGHLMKKAGAPYQELLEYAEPAPKDDTKIALLTAMKRVEFVYAAGYVIATSEVGSNESDAASLITEAADVAFVAKWKDKEKETRISARAAKSVKVPLNEVMDEVAKSLGGAGGGHNKAAGGSAKARTKETLKKCVDTFIEYAERIGR